MLAAKKIVPKISTMLMPRRAALRWLSASTFELARNPSQPAIKIATAGSAGST